MRRSKAERPNRAAKLERIEGGPDADHGTGCETGRAIQRLLEHDRSSLWR